MAIDPRQRGNRTYYYTIIRSVFEGYEYLSKLMQEIGEEAQTKVKGQFEAIDIIQLPRSEKFGPRAELEIRDGPFLKYETTVYRDGWKTKIFIHNTWPGSELEKEIFGQAGHAHVWTQETEKVPDLIAGLAKEARRAIKWQPKP